MPPMQMALYQPEIPENTAAILRLAACLDLRLHLIEPLGFALNTKKMRRIGMDYRDLVRVERHASFGHFRAAHPKATLVLATTKSARPHWDHHWQDGHILLMGQESSGVPQDVHAAADHRLTIPMAPGARSLNLASAATLICGEWQRQRNLSL